MLLYLVNLGVFGEEPKAMLLSMMSGRWEAFNLLLIDMLGE